MEEKRKSRMSKWRGEEEQDEQMEKERKSRMSK